MDEITFGYNLPHNDIDFRMWVTTEYKAHHKWKITFEGNLDLREYPNVVLPENLTVNGFLDVSYLGLTKLPKKLTVNGGLYAKYNKLTYIPDDLFVKHCLYLDYNKITKEIMADVGESTFMDNEQKFMYNRCVKINKIANNIKIRKQTKKLNTFNHE